MEVNDKGVAVAPVLGKKDVFRLAKDAGTIIVPDVGIGFQFGRKKRDPIPQWVLNLQKMWEAGLFHDTEGLGGQLQPCRRCGSMEEVWGSGSIVSVCGLCL